jgi:uncharacterized protein YegL
VGAEEQAMPAGGSGRISESELGNGDPKCPLVLLLDTSESMGFDRVDGEGDPLPLAIDELNRGLGALSAALKADAVAKRRVEVKVITFGGSVEERGGFTLARDWNPPRLSARYDTPMAEAITRGIAAATERRKVLRSCGGLVYRPWVFLLTDGEPSYSVKDIPDQIARAEKAGDIIFWSIAAHGANEDILKFLSSKSTSRPILKFDEANWSSLFEWISDSVAKVSRSRPGDQVAVDPWMMTV